MTTLKLDSNNDLVIDNNLSLFLLKGESDEEIKQRLVVRLQFFKGEWFLNSNHGVPYLFNEAFNIIGEKPANINIIESVIRREVLSVKGVKSISEMTFDYDENNRKLEVDFSVVSTNGTPINNIVSTI